MSFNVRLFLSVKGSAAALHIVQCSCLGLIKTASYVRMIDEMERLWKEPVVA